MNRTFWVTLRNIPYLMVKDTISWLTDNHIETTSANSGPYTNSGLNIIEYLSYSFTNDDDAMLFKLTWSDYL
jgi:hypothetical protein